MGILAKKNMLRILKAALGVIVPVSWIFNAWAGNSFFDEDTAIHTPQYGQPCAACSEETADNSSDVRGLAEWIILFINPDNRLSDDAVHALVQFKKDFPNWQVSGVIVAGLSGLKEKLLRKAWYFDNGMEFSVDIGKKLTKKFAIRVMPAYIIRHNGKQYIITGRPDLSQAIANLDK